MKTISFGCIAALALIADFARAENQTEDVDTSVTLDESTQGPSDQPDQVVSDEPNEADAEAVEQDEAVQSESRVAAASTTDGSDGTAAQVAEHLANLPDEIQSDGAFRYTVPIKIPSFRGLEPNLALVYNSSQKLFANEGPITGIGWSLSGLSVIERVSIGGGMASFVDGEDIYRIDGQELLACADADATSPYDPALVTGSAIYPARFETTNYSASCASGGDFVSLMDDGRRVEILQDSDSSVMFPQFIVTDPNGTQHVYESIGKLKGLFGIAGAAQTPVDYGYRTKFVLTEIRDTQSTPNVVSIAYEFDDDLLGNYVPPVLCDDLSFFQRFICNATNPDGISEPGYYEQSNFDITPHVSTIQYAGYEIAFNYIEQPNPLRTYGAGHADLLGQNNRLLTSVAVTDQTLGVKAYELAYEDSPQFGRKRLAAATEYGGDFVLDSGIVMAGTALPSVVFSYTDDLFGFERVNYSIPEQTARSLTADFDEDGRTDITFQLDPSVSRKGVNNTSTTPVTRDIYHFSSSRSMTTESSAISLPIPYRVEYADEDLRYVANSLSNISGPNALRGTGIFGTATQTTRSQSPTTSRSLYNANGANVDTIAVAGQYERSPDMNLDRDPGNELLARLVSGDSDSGNAYEVGISGFEPMGLDVIFPNMDFIGVAFISGDFDGNGLSDIATNDALYLGFETGFQKLGIHDDVMDKPHAQSTHYAADMNGDGLDDIVRIYDGDDGSGLGVSLQGTPSYLT